MKLLSGINNVWKGTTEQWQTTAGDYTDEANGYKAGDGPNPHNAVNNQPSDYVAEGTEIADADTWQANIQYVIDVTADRSEEQELFAFLDDIRSKSYGTIDGYGPLTAVHHSKAYKSPIDEGGDTAFVTFTTESGILGRLDISRTHSSGYNNETYIIGTEGTM